MMLTTMIALAAAAGAAPSAAPVAAASDDVSAWVAQVNRKIESHLARPLTNDDGMAIVSFRRGEDGRPVEITVRSGSPFVSRAAIQTMRRVGTLPPMPASMPRNQIITLKFLIGTIGHEAEYYSARTTMMAAARRSNLALATQLASRAQVASVPASKTVELAALEHR